MALETMEDFKTDELEYNVVLLEERKNALEQMVNNMTKELEVIDKLYNKYSEELTKRKEIKK